MSVAEVGPQGLARALDAGESGLFRSRPPVRRLLRLGLDRGWRVLHLDTTGVTDKAGLLAAAERDLELPDWFGHNWDALADSLSDLVDDRGVLLVWSGDAELDPDTRRTTREILAERAGEARGAFVAVLASD
ncbi:barstar family protein [Luteipulveratus flavus]|uniref:Barstar family protein n=1 Tax=Luteipulveratus flavus TaxID=3031728 RepID=A0ABT6C2T1_9MICO|nr:barstar family protein [Luteipulveratus sp. YIM 133296]MDF8263078.1 barstar family protein [Luteipulveratus sp. YIM 133296]